MSGNANNDINKAWLDDVPTGEVPDSHAKVGFAVRVGGIIPEAGLRAEAELTVNGSPHQSLTVPFTVKPPADTPDGDTLVPTSGLDLDRYQDDVVVSCKLTHLEGPFTIDTTRNTRWIHVRSLRQS